MPTSEIVMLHDPDAERSLVILFFENEDDSRQGDQTLNAMPAGDTPGQRASVSKYDVAIRMSSTPASDSRAARHRAPSPGP